MNEQNPSVDIGPYPTKRSLLLRILRYVARVIFAVVAGIVYAVFLCAWHLLYFVLCRFRPVVDAFMFSALFMPLVAFVVIVKPDAASGIPFWAFLLASIGCFAIYVGYAKFIDWIAPPDAEDPGGLYRRSEWR